MTEGKCSPTTSPGRGKQCKVLGCTTFLGDGCSRYLQKKRLCAEHLKAGAVRCEHDPQTLYRYCQQFGKLEELSKFQGTKRSCKASLAKRRIRVEASSSPCSAAVHCCAHYAGVSTIYAGNTSSSDSAELSGLSTALAPAAAAETPNSGAASAAAAELWAAAGCNHSTGMQPAAPAAGFGGISTSCANVWTGGQQCMMVYDSSASLLNGGTAAAAADNTDDPWTDADETELVQLIEQELAAAAAEHHAGLPQLPPQGCCNSAGEVFAGHSLSASALNTPHIGSCYYSTGPYNEAAAAAGAAALTPLVMPAAAAAAAAPIQGQFDDMAAKLHALTAQYEAIQAELQLLQEMHASLQQHQQAGGVSRSGITTVIDATVFDANVIC